MALVGDRVYPKENTEKSAQSLLQDFIDSGFIMKMEKDENDKYVLVFYGYDKNLAKPNCPIQGMDD